MKNKISRTLAFIIALYLPVSGAFPAVVRADEISGAIAAQAVSVSSEELEETVLRDPGALCEDFETRAVGSDGKQYEDVEYLSVGAVSRLNEEMRQNYYDACDDIAEGINNGIGQEAVLAVNDRGELNVLVTLEMEELFSAGLQEQFLEEGSEELQTVSENVEALKEMDIIKTETVSLPETAFDVTLQDSDYFRDQLDSVEQEIFDASVEAAEDGINSFTMDGNIRIMDFANAISAAMNTYIRAFEWARGSINLSTSYGDYGAQSTISIEKSPYYSKSLENLAEVKAKKLASDARTYARANYPSDVSYGIVRYINDWICENNYYNQSGTSSNNKTTEVYFNCHSSYGVLLYGYGVCESYAKAATRVLDDAGIRNMYVCGAVDSSSNYGSAGHAWNYVYLSGSWYLLDPTWNDSGSGSNDKYFLVGRPQAEYRGRVPDGTHFNGGMAFSFPALPSYDYEKKTPEVTEPTPTPTLVPTVIPTPTPTVMPTVIPTPTPSLVPTAVPTPTPTPVIIPTPSVTPVPTSEVTPTPSPAPTATPTPLPSGLTEDSFELSDSWLILKAGDKKKLGVYYTDSVPFYYARTWSSSDTSVATVNSNGKVRALKNGTADITLTVGGVEKTCRVYVCKTKLKFDNNASEKQMTCKNRDAIFDSADQFDVSVYVKISKKLLTAEDMEKELGISPSVKCSNSCAEAEITEVSGNEIKLRITPKKAGRETRITVSLNGAKAVLRLTSRYKLREEYFDLSVLDEIYYYEEGTEICPEIRPEPSELPEGISMTNTVAYYYNDRPGTAMVKITGTGKFIGSLTEFFEIE